MRASFDKDVTTCQEYCLFNFVRRVEFPLCLEAQQFCSGISVEGYGLPFEVMALSLLAGRMNVTKLKTVVDIGWYDL